MREIKFRAYIKGFGYQTEENIEWSPLRELMGKGNVDYIWEQYTGLKDKKGVEIYEGDILACKDIVRGIGNEFSIINYKVKYSSRYSCFTVFESQVALEKDYANNSCEVIGNIHENHELLEK